ncbi:MAG: hypothetical protein WCS96_00550 [Victivallales bacterium]
MKDPLKKIVDYIEGTNAFEVMGHFKRLGLLTSDDIRMAAKFTRIEWLIMMKEKAGIAEYMPECDHIDEEENE